MERKWVELKRCDGIAGGKCYSIVATPYMENWHFVVKNEEKGTRYTVLVDNNFERVSCECGDFVYRKAKKGEYCKHIKMVMRDFGYMIRPVIEERKQKELEEAKRILTEIVDMG